MRPPVEHVRVSSKGKEILIKIKRRTGLEHWNEICRIALCRSLSNSNPLSKNKSDKSGESSINMDWKVFAGPFQSEIASLIIYKAHKDKIDIGKKDELTNYIKEHIERGILSMQNIQDLQTLFLAKS